MHTKIIRRDIKHLREVRDRLDREKHRHPKYYTNEEKKLSKVDRAIRKL